MPTLRDKISAHFNMLIQAGGAAAPHVAQNTTDFLNSLPQNQASAFYNALNIMQDSLNSGSGIINHTDLLVCLTPAFGDDAAWIRQEMLLTAEELVQIQTDKMHENFSEPNLTRQINALVLKARHQDPRAFNHPAFLELLKEIDKEIKLEKQILDAMNSAGIFDNTARKKILQMHGTNIGKRLTGGAISQFQAECMPMVAFLQSDNILTPEHIQNLEGVFNVAFGPDLGKDIIELSQNIHTSVNAALEAFAFNAASADVSTTSTTRPRRNG